MKSMHYLGATLFMIAAYTLTAMLFFKGSMESRCRLTEKPINSTYWPLNETITNLCGELECPTK